MCLTFANKQENNYVFLLFVLYLALQPIREFSYNCSGFCIKFAS